MIWRLVSGVNISTVKNNKEKYPSVRCVSRWRFHSPRLCLCPRQGQHMYSIPPGGFRHPYPALAMNASMSR